MATGTRSKRTTHQEMKAKLSARVNQQAGHLASLVDYVNDIADAKASAATEIENLKALGLTMTEIEEATDISMYRLRTFSRQLQQPDGSDSDDGMPDSATEGSRDTTGNKAQGNDASATHNSGEDSRDRDGTTSELG